MNSKSVLILLIIISVSLSSLVGMASKKTAEEVMTVSEEIPASSVKSKNLNNTIDAEKDVMIKESVEKVFEYEPLSEEIKERIRGVSWKETVPYPLDDLVYIQVTYYGFDGKTHIGELIMHKLVAPEIIEIFKMLFEAKYPIEKVKLIDDYDASDEASMADNNSSALCVRSITNQYNELSRHSYGVAIDINPIQNPYISSNMILPEAGENYQDRTNKRKGMIIEGDICYTAFVSRGWTWGGNWTSIKDYQHFQKDVDIPITGDIPEISVDAVRELIINALKGYDEIVYPEGKTIVEHDKKCYVKYAHQLNSKNKIMAHLREFFTERMAEEIYHKNKKIIMNNDLYGVQNIKDIRCNMNNFEIKMLEEQNNEKIKNLIIIGEEAKVHFEMMYIGSQGWRIDNIEEIDFTGGINDEN